MPQTIRLEFAKSNTKVSKPKQPAAAAATSHPALMHPLTGRKYAPPLVHSLDTSHLLFLTHCTLDYKVSHFLLSLGSFFQKIFFYITTPPPSTSLSPSATMGSARSRELYDNRLKYGGQTSRGKPLHLTSALQRVKMHTLYIYICTKRHVVRQWLLYSANYRAH